jgi:hypothetical protein
MLYLVCDNELVSLKIKTESKITNVVDTAVKCLLEIKLIKDTTAPFHFLTALSIKYILYLPTMYVYCVYPAI